MAAVFGEPVVEHAAEIFDQPVVPRAQRIEHPGGIDDLADDAVLVHADEADGGVGAGAHELPLQLLVPLDDLVHATYSRPVKK